MKRVIRAAAVAASVGATALTLNAGFANALPTFPLDPPPCTGPDCHGGPAGGGNGGGGNGGEGSGPQSPRSPETTQAPTTQAPATQSPATQSPATQSPATQSPESTAPAATQSATPSTPSPETSATNTQTSPSSGTQSSATTPSSVQNTTPSGDQNTPTSGQRTAALVAPSTQPPHPPYTPRGTYLKADADVGGPMDTDAGFSIVGHGAPTPPRERGFGWNDGPPPGHEPPHWFGPPPAGGWDGPPPPGGWNRRWDGPPRDIVVARADFAPFAFDDFMAIPIFNWEFGGWGYWYFGTWIPLY